MSKRPFQVGFRLLQVAAISVFLGRAWQHLYWDAPYRTLFWDERLMRWPVRWLLGMEWGEYVTDLRTDAWIAVAIQVSGGLYVLAAIAVALLPRWPRLSRPFIKLGGILLLFLAFLYAKEKSYLWAQFFEYSLQFGSPFFILAAQRENTIGASLQRWMTVAAALTFSCHGLFALGFFPTPGYFIDMVMQIVGASQSQAVVFLRIAGILDLVVSALLFFPKPVALPALGYMVFWGAATTLARVWAYFEAAFWQHTLAQWLHESVMRLPHVLVPLCLFLIMWGDRKVLDFGRQMADSK